MTGARPGEAATGKLAGALGWNAGGLVVQAIFQLMTGLVLARLLGPATYGLMAMAWIALGPAMIIADAGLGLALVQRQLLTSEAIRYCFCAQSMIGLVVAGILCALAPFWAALLATPELENVLLALSSIVLVQAFGLTAVNLLRRCLDFRRLQLLQIAGLLGSTLLVSLPLALAGMGVWSLVAGALTNVAIVAVCASALVRAEPGMRTGLISILAAAAAAVPALLAIESIGRWTVVVAAIVNTLLVSIGVRYATRRSSLRELRRAAAFGTSSMRFLLLNIVNAVIGALPALMIGRLFGVAAVGLYDRAYALIVTPMDRAAAAVSGVLFSYHATLHRVGSGETEVFLRSLKLALFVGMLCAIVVAMNDALIVRLTLGAGWSEAIPFVAPMAVFVVLVLTLQVAVPVLNGRGRPEIEIVIQLGAIALFLLLVSFVAHDSPIELVWALVAAYAFRVLCLLFSVGWLIKLRTGPILRAALPGAVTAIVVLAAERALALVVPGLDSGLGRLAAVGGMSAAAVTVAWSRGLFSDLWPPFGRTGRPGQSS